MKTLYLMRHAKSNWKAPALSNSTWRGASGKAFSYSVGVLPSVILHAERDSRCSEFRRVALRDAQSLCLQLSSKLDCDREITAAESKSELFEEVFGCKLALGPT